MLDYLIDDIDLVLVMTVNPGFGGQSYIPLPDKIRAVAEKISGAGRPIDLEVDGGVNAETARAVVDAGADVLVAGSAVFKGNDYNATIGAIRKAVA